MDWLCDITWFAIHVKRFREALAASSVAELGLEVFLPMTKVECLEHVTIKVGNPEISLGIVECARGVLHVIKSGSIPIPIDEQVIREIQNRVEADGLIRLHRPELKPGDRVAIQAGPFAGMMGRVEVELDDHKRVAILLESLWNARVLIEKRSIEVEAG